MQRWGHLQASNFQYYQGILNSLHYLVAFFLIICRKQYKKKLLLEQIFSSEDHFPSVVNGKLCAFLTG